MQRDPQAVDRVIRHMMSMECTPQSTIGQNLAVTTGDAGVSTCHFGDLSQTGAATVFDATTFEGRFPLHHYRPLDVARQAARHRPSRSFDRTYTDVYVLWVCGLQIWLLISVLRWL